MEGMVRVAPFLAIIAAIGYVMYGGFATPSEIAAIARLPGAGAGDGRSTGPGAGATCWQIFRDTVRESSMILMIIAAAALFSYMMSLLYVTQIWPNGWSAIKLEQAGCCWSLINVFLLVMGCFLPPVAIILMMMPILTPVLEANRFRPDLVRGDPHDPSGQEFQHLRVQRAVAAREDIAALVARPARPVGDHAAGRLDERNQRLHVVRLQAVLDRRCRRSPSRAACSSSSRRRSAVSRARSADGVVDARSCRGDWNCRGSVVATIASSIRAQRRVRSVRRSVAAPPLRDAALRAEERLADERLVHDADHRALRRRAARSASPSAAGRG